MKRFLVAIATITALACARDRSSSPAAAGPRFTARRGDDAVTKLIASANSARSAAAWNDVAAAWLVRDEQSDDAPAAVDALSAANEALAVDPRFAPAVFNRAYAIERLGLVTAARRAWQEYLAVDGRSPWSDVALQRLHNLTPSNDADAFKRALPLARSEAALCELVRQFPQASRAWGEGIVMSEWADATLAGDPVLAARRLETARVVGDALRQGSGEALLADAVAVARDATRSGSAADLAHAYVVYRDGRRAHADDNPVKAEPTLREAAAAFGRCGSPMEYVARYYAGSALHAQLRLAEAAAALDALAGRHPEERSYLALAAMIGWERGGCALERGSISDGLEIFTRSRDLFNRIGEYDYAAVMNAFLAVSYAFTGDEQMEWRARRQAFAALSRSGNEMRSTVILESAAASLTRNGRWREAEALLDLTIDVAERRHDALVAVHALTHRALAGSERGNRERPRKDIEEARQWARQLKDPATRKRAEIEVTYAEAIDMRGVDPHNALAHLDNVLRFYGESQRRVEMPPIYLERARTALLAGDSAAARRDAEAGIEVVSYERRHVSSLEQRASLIATANSLFELAIGVAARQNDYESAFALSEQRNARALAEMFELGSDAKREELAPMPLHAIRDALASDAAIVSFVSLSDRVITFVIRRDGFFASTMNVPHAKLVSTLDAFQNALHKKPADVIATASEADALLLRPIRSHLEHVDRVAFVTDRDLSGVPFAAMYDATRGRFLVEDVAVTAAPSASLLIETSQRLVAKHGSSLLAVGASRFDHSKYPRLEPLAFADREARSVARLYPEVHVLTAENATKSAVLAAAHGFDVLHFACHAVADRYAPRSALLLAPGGGDSGELRVSDLISLQMPATHVVVLAACGSASEVTRNDGAENIARAFIAAGVPSVVATLADLDDGVSSRFMIPLHQRLASGDDAVTAMHHVAMENVRDAAGRIRPSFDWSNFVVVGGSSGFLNRSSLFAPARAPRTGRDRPTAVAEGSSSRRRE